MSVSAFEGGTSNRLHLITSQANDWLNGSHSFRTQPSSVHNNPYWIPFSHSHVYTSIHYKYMVTCIRIVKRFTLNAYLNDACVYPYRTHYTCIPLVNSMTNTMCRIFVYNSMIQRLVYVLYIYSCLLLLLLLLKFCSNANWVVGIYEAVQRDPWILFNCRLELLCIYGFGSPSCVARLSWQFRQIIPLFKHTHTRVAEIINYFSFCWCWGYFSCAFVWCFSYLNDFALIAN